MLKKSDLLPEHYYWAKSESLDWEIIYVIKDDISNDKKLRALRVGEDYDTMIDIYDEFIGPILMPNKGK